MRKGEINDCLNSPLNMDEVKKAFIENWTICFFLGEVTYLQLQDDGYIAQNNEEYLALILIGVDR